MTLSAARTAGDRDVRVLPIGDVRRDHVSIVDNTARDKALPPLRFLLLLDLI